MGDSADQNSPVYFLGVMGVVTGTLYRSHMVKFLSWTIYFHDFESYLFDRELFYEQGRIRRALSILKRKK